MVESPGKMYALATTLTLLALAAVICRFWARRIKNIRPSWDDYLIVLALVSSLSLIVESGLARLTVFCLPKISTVGTGVCMFVGKYLQLSRHRKYAKPKCEGAAVGSLGRHTEVTSESIPIFSDRAEVFGKV